MYNIVYSKKAKRDVEKIKNSDLSAKARKIISLIQENPFQTPPPYEKLLGDLTGAYSRRLNSKHRIVYQVFEEEKIIRLLSLWSHYENI